MPIEYSGIIDEHLTVCNAVGRVRRLTHGRILGERSYALQFIQDITSNNAAVLTPGKVQYTCFPNETGGIVDDLLVYCNEPEKYMLVVNAATSGKTGTGVYRTTVPVLNWENASDRMAQLAIQGPKALSVLQKLTSVNLAEIPYYHFCVGDFAGVPQVILSNTGYTGAEASNFISIRKMRYTFGRYFRGWSRVRHQACRIGCTRHIALRDGFLSVRQ